MRAALSSASRDGGVAVVLGASLGFEAYVCHTQGLNPRLAGRVPGRPATHTPVPYPGQVPALTYGVRTVPGLEQL